MATVDNRPLACALALYYFHPPGCLCLAPYYSQRRPRPYCSCGACALALTIPTSAAFSCLPYPACHLHSPIRFGATWIARLVLFGCHMTENAAHRGSMSAPPCSSLLGRDDRRLFEVLDDATRTSKKGYSDGRIADSVPTSECERTSVAQIATVTAHFRRRAIREANDRAALGRTTKRRSRVRSDGDDDPIRRAGGSQEECIRRAFLVTARPSPRACMLRRQDRHDDDAASGSSTRAVASFGLRCSTPSA